VEEDAVLGPERVRADDVLVAYESSGLHTNGYSLARRIVSERLRLAPTDPVPDAGGASTADVLLAIHRSYLAAVAPVLDLIHAMAHITGGGLPGNLNRALPPGLDAVVETRSWDVPSVFLVLERAGAVARDEMFRAFNMGVGLVAHTAPDSVDAVRASADAAGVRTWVLGQLTPGAGQVLFA
jgi:phosphoribosylformylglycinamidine cyclo-ligase